MAEEQKKVEVKRRPQAKKRDIQNEKNRLNNRAYRSKTASALRALHTSLSSNPSASKEHLNTLYSLMDKGVKTGVFKANKASRVKARLTKRVNAGLAKS
ncbi:MAG: 30S ribosomal protein S20 [Chlamydiales bacterium]